MSDLTDEEKAERIKQWWADNGMAIVAGLVLGVAGLFGWNWWSDREETRAQAASEMYQALQVAGQTGQTERALELADAVIEQGRGTPYRALAWVYRADVAISQGDAESAISALEAARDAAPDRGYREVVTLRLARQMILAERFDDAEVTLADIRSDAFTGLKRELEGDLARARGDREGALEHYEAALDAGHSPEYLRLKYEELSV
ncbi:MULTISPECIES: tetratricopeptide repeat protein [unclassified Thioalkalivibrio]|uniref:YfgM family protein n=1 Tax=unclassified Thioalkalivibrio TaxID=2621013 RepID=UPI000373CB10|nr:MULTISPECIES: tetratricopeptide repeat protein [unclassified Thioalkalivibrio]